MSQRECAGFNWPPLSIPAEEPICICPMAVSRAGPVQFGSRVMPDPATSAPHSAAVLRPESVLPASL
jgi:hypothetical protein